ncbi:MAG: polysaccharide pyruvyl transferase CsaB [Clostridiales bacterium]|nr:polysaccharide pyruvyl transferase CsaB [Clostridiales bacterium]
MRVVHLIGGGDVGGAKIHVLSLVKELSKNIDVKIIALREGIFSREARSMGLDIEVVKGKSIISDLRKVIEIVKKGEYDFLHSHGAKANLFAVACKFMTKVCTITTVHSDYRLDYLQSKVKKLVYGTINAISIRFLHFYVAVSSEFKGMLVNRNFREENIYTLYNGIDFNLPVGKYNKDVVCEKYGLKIDENDYIVGILARLHPVKDIPTFLEASAKVLKSRKNVKFIIGGDGEQKAYLEKYARNLGVLDNVYFVGFVDNPYEFMSIVDVNVLTSLSESFPYSILEGTKLKKATISTDVGGIFDLIDHNKNGYLFNVGDYDLLAKYILNLLDDDELRNRFGEELNRKARKEFSLERMGETQLNIYYEIKNREKDVSHKVSDRYDVLISGYYGHNNMGDEAMLEAIVDTLKKERKRIKLAVLSQKPEETTKIHNVRSIYRFNLFSILKMLMKTDLYINGGGSLIQDNTSNRSLYYYLTLIVLAKLTRTKVMIYANGIGPVKNKFNKYITRVILNLVDIITVRDENSLVELEKLGVHGPKIELTADCALTLKSVSDERISEILREEGIDENRSLIGFSIRQWGDDLEYLNTIAKVADVAYEKYGLMPVFIAMQKNNDSKMSERIVKKMSSPAYIVRGNYSPKEILGIIGRVDILIGMRLHALVFASMEAVPCIGVVYEQKVEGFVNYIRQMSAGDVKKLEAGTLCEMLDEECQHRNMMKEYLVSIRKELQDKSIRNAKLALELLDRRKKRRI